MNCIAKKILLKRKIIFLVLTLLIALNTLSCGFKADLYMAEDVQDRALDRGEK